MSQPPTHPIFRGPLAVELDLEEVPTPPKYQYYELETEVPATLTAVKILEKEWDTLDLPIGERPDKSTAGVVTTGDGFLDSPDMERIAGGINLKGPEYVAIGRQGRLLQWGFFGSPEEMTETGRRLLINAIHYIHRFRGHPIQATREAVSRESLATTLSVLDVYGSDDMKEYYETPEKVQEAVDRNLKYLFGDDVPAAARGSKEERRAWYTDHRPYLYWEGARTANEYDGKVYYRLEGQFTIDEDVAALGVANDDVALLRRAVDDLDAGVETEARARRILARYTDQEHETAADWRRWLDASQDELYLSDWNGYRFLSRLAPGAPDATSSGRIARRGETLADLPELERPAVKVALSAAAEGEAVKAILDFEVEPGWWVYAPGSGAQFELDVRAPAGFGYQLAAAPILPQADSQGRLRDRFRVEVPLEGKGGVATLLVGFQACDEQRCHLPVTDARMACKVEAEAGEGSAG